MSRYWSVLSGPSIRDVIPMVDCEFDEDGMVSQSSHTLGAKCPCGPGKRDVGSFIVAGVVEVQFVHRALARPA